jgi:hypothetical protein
MAGSKSSGLEEAASLGDFHGSEATKIFNYNVCGKVLGNLPILQERNWYSSYCRAALEDTIAFARYYERHTKLKISYVCLFTRVSICHICFAFTDR